MRKYLILIALLCFKLNVFAQAFTAGNLVVLRLGAGDTAVLGQNKAAPVFLDEYTTSGTLVRSIAIESTTGVKLVLPGLNSVTGEGILTLSSNGKYVGLVGYNLSLKAATNVARTTIAAVVKSDGSVVYTNGNTFFNSNTGFQANSFLSEDAVGGYVAGHSTASRIIRYNPELAPVVTTGRVDLFNSSTTTPRRFRQLQVFKNQLYTTCGNQDPDASQIYSVGSGVPTSIGQAISPIAFSGSSVQNAIQFAVVDMDANTPGPDVMYVASNGSRNIEKYSLVGSNWIFNDSLVLSGNEKFFGITAVKSGNNVLIYATKDVDNAANSVASKLVMVTDNTGYNSAANTFRNLSTTVLAIAATNTQFRGIVAAPFRPTYYLKPGATDISVASNYSSNVSGVGGSAPVDLYEDASFVITNNASITMSSSTTFGSNASVTIGDGSTQTILTIPSGITLTAGSVTTLPTVANNSTVVIASGATYLGRLSVNAGASLTVNGTFENNLAANSGIIAGTLTVNGTYNLTANGALSFTTTGTPTLNFANNSTINITGVTTSTSVLTGLFLANASVGNVVWNSIVQSSNGTISGSTSGILTVKGNFTVASTGSTGNHIFLTNGTSSRTISILGNLNVDGGELRICGNNTASSNTGFGNIQVAGNVNINGGALNISASNGTGTGVLSLAGNLTHSSGILTNTSTGSGTRGILEFNGTSAQSITTTGVSILNDTTFNLKVNNASGVTLNAPLLAIDTLILENGNMTINQADTLSVLGITTTSQNGFGTTKSIVTKTLGTSADMGFVRLRKVLPSSTTIVPLTTLANSYYSPVSLSVTDTSDFYVNTFQGLTKNGLPNGASLDAADISKSVNQTWTINRNIGNNPVTLNLAWNAANEGALFTSFSDNNIGISRYSTVWDAARQSAGNNSTNNVTASLNVFGPMAITQLNTTLLPLHFTSVSILDNQNSTATINWQVADENEVSNYVVEASNDGLSFETAITSVKPKNSGFTANYSYLISLVNNTASYFRIKAVKLDGSVLYSATTSIKNKTTEARVSVYPTVLSSSTPLQVSINNVKAGKYSFKLVDISGRIMISKTIQHNANNSVYYVSLPNQIAKGTYMMVIASENAIITTKSVIIY